MNRSKTVAAKCFVPFCKNTTTNSPEKLFLNVSDNGLRARWCHELNIAYSRTKRMFCCSNHFDMKDLLYFKEWKLNNKRLALKPTAVLRNNESADSPSTSHDHQYENQYNKEDIDRTESSVSSSVLQNLLLAPVLQTHKETAAFILTNIKPSIPEEESTPAADEEESSLLEEEIWAELAPPPSCSECAGAADVGGKLYQCLECPFVICANCELADKHPLHCLLRLPSLNVYGIMKDLFDTLREEVTTRLLLNDGQPGCPLVEPKTEPIFEDQDQDPLSLALPKETSDRNNEQILITTRTVGPNPRPTSKNLSAFELIEPTATTDDWKIAVKRKKEDNNHTRFMHKPLIIRKKKKLTTFEVPLTANTHEPLTTTSHKPLTTTVQKPLVVDKPLTSRVPKPLTTIVDKPLTTIKHEPMDIEEIVVKSETEITVEDTPD